jgi:hypothetical protein
MLEFAGIQITNGRIIHNIVDFASLDNMRKMEAKNPLPQYGNNVKKIGTGIIKGYRGYFRESDRKYFKEMVDKKLHSNFGYDYSTW